MLPLSTLKMPFCHFKKFLILIYYFKKKLISKKKKKKPRNYTKKRRTSLKNKIESLPHTLAQYRENLTRIENHETHFPKCKLVAFKELN